MALPVITPPSKISAITLPSIGTFNNVATNLPFGMYSSDVNFLSGATDQVSFTYKMLGGDVLDIELTEHNVYAAYEAAVLEYSYLINIHQSKNVLNNVLGNATGTFNHDGELNAGQLSSSLGGIRIELRYPSFNIGYVRQVATAIANEAGVGGTVSHYSASFAMTPGQQSYNLQNIISSSVSGTSIADLVGNNRIVIRKVYHKSRRANWRFYAGLAGGGRVMGNLSSYGQWADDSTFEVVPVWQNKLQAMAYEDALYTRTSHYSYEINNNNIKIYPSPSINDTTNTSMWVDFSIEGGYDQFELGASATAAARAGGINNMNTIPFANIPYQNINSIGKQWIRRFALAICKEMLGQIRSKFSVVPIPGESITLNGAELLSQAKEEQTALREELKTILSEMTYEKLSVITADAVDAAHRVLEKIPMAIYTG